MATGRDPELIEDFNARAETYAGALVLLDRWDRFYGLVKSALTQD